MGSKAKTAEKGQTETMPVPPVTPVTAPAPSRALSPCLVPKFSFSTDQNCQSMHELI